MHLEILVEGKSEKHALNALLPKIIDLQKFPLTYAIHPHRGNGKLPEDPLAEPNRKDPTLLHNLPAKLRAYGESLDTETEAVVVLVDLDDHPDCYEFKQSLIGLLKHCKKNPRVLFRIAIEELEAWYFGDRSAIKKVFPRAKEVELNAYRQDEQDCTWERLADAVVPGGISKLKKTGRSAGGREKVKWSKLIPAEMDVENNQSPSFVAFRDGIRALVKQLR